MTDKKTDVVLLLVIFFTVFFIILTHLVVFFKWADKGSLSVTAGSGTGEWFHSGKQLGYESRQAGGEEISIYQGVRNYQGL